MLKAVLFDLGGTLVDFAGGDLDSYRASFLAVAAKHPDRYQEIVSAHTQYLLLRHKALVTLQEATFEEALNRTLYDLSRTELRILLEELHEQELKRASLCSETQEALRSLHMRGMRMGLVSNNPFPSSILRLILTHFGIREYFEVVVSSADVAVRKPNPDIFFVALDAMHIAPCDALYVGDTIEKDVAGAKAAGMKAAWINRKSQSTKAPIHDYDISSLFELVAIVK